VPPVDDLIQSAPRLAALAADAGRLILDLVRAGIDVSAKDDLSPVTNADLCAEERLLAGLHDILPGVPVLAEESASRGDIPDVGDTFLVIDPLDGTREFVAGRPEYTVNIGLVAGGRPVLGVLHAPALGRTYWGVVGHGAMRAIHAPGAVPAADGFEPIATRPRAAAALALTSRGYNDAATEAFLDELGIGERQRLGSAYKFALVAEGSADLYPRFGPTMEWDLAAGHALVEAAGGVVLTPEGQAIRYAKAETGFRNGPFVAWGRPPGV
jgi:3'(2'), 5'-bisphosphate nucleotidase